MGDNNAPYVLAVDPVLCTAEEISTALAATLSLGADNTVVVPERDLVLLEGVEALCIDTPVRPLRYVE